jgi:hypothetical protein
LLIVRMLRRWVPMLQQEMEGRIEGACRSTESKSIIAFADNMAQPGEFIVRVVTSV